MEALGNLNLIVHMDAGRSWAVLCSTGSIVGSFYLRNTWSLKIWDLKYVCSVCTDSITVTVPLKPSSLQVLPPCLFQVERHDMNTLSLPLNIRRGGSDTNLNFDVPDGILDFHKVKLSADSLKQKILKVTEQIKIEQTSRDGNVAEYLKLVNSADKQQAGRIKQVFEKKNQKSAHSIAQLQKKLEQYHRKLREIEQNGASRSAKDIAKDNLKDVPHSLKDAHAKSRTAPHGTECGKSGMPGVSLTPPVFVFNKSREFANLIRNKFGSADNIAHLKNSLEEFRPEGSPRAYGGSATIVNKPKYGSDDECSSGTSGSADSNGNQSFGASGAGTLDSQGKLTVILEELREIKDTQAQLAEDIEALKVQFKREYGFISQTLQEERYRYVRLFSWNSSRSTTY